MTDEPGDEPPAEKPKYDQAFFIALALKGKDDWNAWRRANDEPVSFAGVGFSKEPNDQFNFSGFEFGDDADFSGCKWRGAEFDVVDFNLESSMAGSALFTGAAFGSDANFASAAFGD